jgi:hypothetical protein
MPRARRLMPPLLIVLACLLIVSPPGPAQPGERGKSKHPRLKEEKPKGTRDKLSIGTLFVPEKAAKKGTLPLWVHFHGPGWIAEVAAARAGRAVVSVQLGSGSAVYAKPFQGTKKLGELVREAEKKAKVRFELHGLSGWSAGYGAVRAILRDEEYYRDVRWVVLMDGMHAGYQPKAKPKPLPADLDSFVRFGKAAVAGKRTFLITHSRIVPGSYASTTETADYLLAQVGASRAKAKGPGPGGLPVETEAHKGGLRVFGCAGATAEDHVDHLHALPALVGLVEAGRK